MYHRAVFFLLMLVGATSGLNSQAIRIPGPSPLAALRSPPAISNFTKQDVGGLARPRSKPATWKSALIIGGVTAVIAGVAIAAMPGDEGSTRTTADRVKSGVVGGLVIAVPITVLFVLLAGDG